MGIFDGGKIEEYLADEIAPNAFYYALPSNARIALVSADQSALVCAAFSSVNNMTTHELTTNILSKVNEHFQSPPAERSNISIAVRDTDDCCAHVMRQQNPASVPTLADLQSEYAQRNDSELFAVRLTADATVCLTADKSDFTPSNRSMLHEDRYGSSRTMTNAALAELGGRILGTHPLVGYKLKARRDALPDDVKDDDDEFAITRRDLESLADISALRRAAYGNSQVRAALHTYVPLAMALSLIDADATCPSCGKRAVCARLSNLKRHSDGYDRLAACLLRKRRMDAEMRPEDTIKYQELLDDIDDLYTFLQAPPLAREPTDNDVCACDLTACNERRLIIDSVAIDMDIDEYARYPTHNVPKDVYATAQANIKTVVLLPSSKRVAEIRDRPAIGECDLKLVDDILTHSKNGDDVLVCNRDSDILHVLLHNMHRFMDTDGTFTRRIFLDTWHPRVRADRLMRRFVCINRLYVGIISYGEREWGLSDSVLQLNALAIISGAAFFCGSDYTVNIKSVGPAKILSVLRNSSFMRNVAPHALAMPDDLETIDQLLVGEADDGDRASRLPNLCVFRQEFVKVFVAQVIIEALPELTRGKLLAEPDTLRYDWDHLRASHRATGPRAVHIPEFSHVLAMWRRISWTLNYFGNAPCGIGVFPSPTATDTDATSLWGWTYARRNHVAGTGKTREVVLSSGWLDMMPDHGERGNDWVAACDSRIASDDSSIFVQCYAEYLAKREIGRASYAFEILPPQMND